MEDDRHVSAIPITNDDGKLVGMLTPGDVAEYNMRNITDPTIQDIPLFNLCSVSWRESFLMSRGMRSMCFPGGS